MNSSNLISRVVGEMKNGRVPMGERPLEIQEILERSGFCGSARLADDAVDGFGGLGTDGKPFVGFFEVDGEVGAFEQRVIGPELFDIATVAALAAVHSDDFVVRAVFGSLAVESDSYGHDAKSLRCPESGGRGNWRIAGDLPSRISGDFDFSGIGCRWLGGQARGDERFLSGAGG